LPIAFCSVPLGHLTEQRSLGVGGFDRKIRLPLAAGAMKTKQNEKRATVARGGDWLDSCLQVEY
jgi:hypothetical protein